MLEVRFESLTIHFRQFTWPFTFNNSYITDYMKGNTQQSIIVTLYKYYTLQYNLNMVVFFTTDCTIEGVGHVTTSALGSTFSLYCILLIRHYQSGWSDWIIWGNHIKVNKMASSKSRMFSWGTHNYIPTRLLVSTAVNTHRWTQWAIWSKDALCSAHLTAPGAGVPPEDTAAPRCWDCPHCYRRAANEHKSVQLLQWSGKKLVTNHLKKKY